LKVTNCLQRHTSVPNTFLEWSTDALQYENDEEATVTMLCDIAAEYVNFRADMRRFRDFDHSVEIICAVLKIDAKFEAWACSCLPQYTYDIISMSEPSEEVFTDHYHRYRSLWTATVWNNYRCIRVLVNELLLVHFIHLDITTHKEELATCNDQWT
jgi:hypothetical protein